MTVPSRRAVAAVGLGSVVAAVATACAVWGAKLPPSDLISVPDGARVGLPAGAPKPVELIFTGPGRPRGTPTTLSQEAERRRATPDATTSRAQRARSEVRAQQVAAIRQQVTQFGELRYLRSRRVPDSACRAQIPGADPILHTFFSYSMNLAVYVRMCGSRLSDVRARAGAQPAASKDEQAEAIALARQDPRLKDQVVDLREQALVIGTCRGHALAGACAHRTLFVAFTRFGEEAPRYQAEVDLVDRRVLVSGPSAPAPAVRPGVPPLEPADLDEGREVWSGTVAWKGWTFRYEMDDGAQAGLVIENVQYQGQRFIRKMSLPVIRVKYDKGCGPFMDQIDRDVVRTIQPTVPASRGADQRGPCPSAICYREWTDGDIAWLELGVYARIGQHHVYQAYYFSGPAHDRGPRPPAQIAPVVWSGGVACDTVHTHHPYWRFHFDIDGQGQDQVAVRRGNRWAIHNSEGEDVKTMSAGEAAWLVRRPDSRRGVWIVPGDNDGTPDRFANHDLSVRRYHDDEDGDWEFGFFEDLGYADKEAVDRQNDVVWYVAHAHHRPSAEARNRWQWHRVGPYLMLQLGR